MSLPGRQQTQPQPHLKGVVENSGHAKVRGAGELVPGEGGNVLDRNTMSGDKGPRWRQGLTCEVVGPLMISLCSLSAIS